MACIAPPSTPCTLSLCSPLARRACPSLLHARSAVPLLRFAFYPLATARSRIFSPLFGPPSVAGPDAGPFMRYCLIIRRQYPRPSCLTLVDTGPAFFIRGGPRGSPARRGQKKRLRPGEICPTTRRTRGRRSPGRIYSTARCYKFRFGTLNMPGFFPTPGPRV